MVEDNSAINLLGVIHFKMYFILCIMYVIIQFLIYNFKSVLSFASSNLIHMYILTVNMFLNTFKYVFKIY